MPRKKSPEKMTQAEFEVWRGEDQRIKQEPRPQDYPKLEGYEEALRKWEVELSKNLRKSKRKLSPVKTSRVSCWGMDERSLRKYKPDFMDLYDDAPPYIKEKVLAPERLKKVLYHLLKKPAVTPKIKKLINNKLAQAAALKLHQKHPEYNYGELMWDRSVDCHLTHATTYHSRYRILKKVLPSLR
jgi:hypothetical protein